MGVSGDDTDSLERNSWDESRLDHQRSNTMRIGLKYITPVLAAGAAAVAIAAAPTAAAASTPAQPAVIATAPTAPADHVVQVDDHHGGDHGGWGWGHR
jgi:hypothetical protein